MVPGDLVLIRQHVSVRQQPYVAWLDGDGSIKRRTIFPHDGLAYLVISTNRVEKRDPNTLRDVEFSFLHPRYGVLWWWVNERGVVLVRPKEAASL